MLAGLTLTGPRSHDRQDTVATRPSSCSDVRSALRTSGPCPVFGGSTVSRRRLQHRDGRCARARVVVRFGWGRRTTSRFKCNALSESQSVPRYQSLVSRRSLRNRVVARLWEGSVTYSRRSSSVVAAGRCRTCFWEDSICRRMLSAWISSCLRRIRQMPLRARSHAPTTGPNI